MWKSLACALLFALANAFLTVPALSASTEAVSRADQGAAKKPKKAKKARPAKTAKPAPKAPERPKESWELPMKVVIVRNSAPNCEPLCPEWIMAEGEITDQSPGVFRKALKKLGKRKLPVVISSPGGSINAAMEIGRLIRKNKLDVAVGNTFYEGCAPFGAACELPKSQNGIYRGKTSSVMGYCHSACPLVLAGGVNRIVDDYVSIGVHQARTYWTQERITYRETYRIVKGKKKVISRKVVSRKPAKGYTTYGFDKRLRKSMTAYVKEMGITADIMADMDKAPHSSIYRLTANRQKELRLTTRNGSAHELSGAGLCPAAAPAPSCVEREGFVPAPPPAAALDYRASLRRLSINPDAPSMVFAIVRNSSGGCEPLCPQWISAEGPIAADSPEKLKAVLDTVGSLKLPVVFDSVGGDFDAALELGRLIRKRGLATAAVSVQFIRCTPSEPACAPNSPSQIYKGFPYFAGRCDGACLFAAMGGVMFTTGQSLHRLHHPSVFVSRAGKSSTTDLLKTYFAEMNASKELLPRMQRLVPYEAWHPQFKEEAAILGMKHEHPTQLLPSAACKSSNPPDYCVKSATGS